jgi:hypothetical protein
MNIPTREWATPLTAGTFLLMAVTGVLIFFHLDSGLNKAAHEWLGWAMIVGVAAHIVANLPAFKRYLTSRVGSDHCWFFFHCSPRIFPSTRRRQGRTGWFWRPPPFCGSASKH